VAIVQ
jgi:2-oxoisovalerate dehydrogenase E1 component